MYFTAANDDIRLFQRELNIYGRVLFDEPLSGYTSMGVGGCAKILVFPQDIADLTRTCEFARQNNLALLILGGGCNLLVGGEGVSGVVICLKEGFNSIARKGDGLVVQAGAKLPMVVSFAQEEELGGLEILAGIPGTLGGAVYMNAGTHDGCIAQVLEEVKILTADFKLKALKKDQLGFGYRHSSMPQGSIILEAKLKLVSRSRVQIEKKMRKILTQRRSNQPIGEKSAGCIFKNPPNEYAGKLIEGVGLKGYSVKDAQVSEKHANFIINKGQATAQSILQLIELIKKRVWQERGIRLEEEVIIVGQE